MSLKRSIQEWRNLDPVSIAQRQGRPVAKHALVDAKHDILALAARVEELERALAESQANDRKAMAYLSEVRALVGGDDFPDMVRRCEKLQAECEKLRNLLRHAQPIIRAHAEASHMLEGFRPRRNQWDELAEGIDAAIQEERNP